MRLDECEPGRRLKTRNNELIQVQKVEYNRMRAQILYPLSKTPVWKEYGADLVGVMQDPSPELLKKYEDAVAERRSKGKKRK